MVRTLKAELEAKGKLKDVLYIQLDNAPNSNKNKFVLFFCALLVAWKLFRKVKVSFLLVGHTHEDIDQMFSRFAEALRRADVTSWQQMASLFRNSFTFDLEPPTVHFMKDVYDYKAWMAPHMPKMKHHTDPMCFKMELDATSNHVRVFARHTMSGSKREATHWQPAQGYQLVSVAVAEAMLLEDIPRVAPRPVNTELIRKTVTAFAEAEVLDEASVQLWDTYLASIDEDVANACDECNRLRQLEATYAITKIDTKAERKLKNKNRRHA